ncbi:MAG TPA: EAL domain-containing protein, partial [Acidimicrobiales bacterium]|nr:EAL domain-containing protein [Acidimicrobiales bacterium]
SAGSRALVRASDERALYGEMCEIATGEGGYALAWYARRVEDESFTVDKYASSARNRGYLDRISVDWSDGPLGQGPAGRSIRTGETIVVPDFVADERFAPWRDVALEYGFRTSVALPVRVDGEVDGSLMVYASEPDAFKSAAVSVLEDLAAELGFGVERLRDRQRLLATLRDQQLLSRAIEQADEVVLILDPAFTIIYANPATVRSSGYALDEILGQTPHMFGAGTANQEFDEEVWTTLSRGHSWHGSFINRRKNGELYEETASISPILDEGGKLIAFVEVKNDVSAERRIQGLEEDIARSLDDRTALLSVMGTIRAADNVHATAYLFCEAARQLPGVEVAGILLIRDNGELLPISVAGADLPQVNEERPIDTGGPEFLSALSEGARLLPLDPTEYSNNRDLVGTLVAEGITCLTLAPIRWQAKLIGVLALAARDPLTAEKMRGRLLYYEEIASYAGSLLGEQAQSYEERSVLRAEIRGVIERREFATVYQPEIDLSTGSIVGYEALTRFSDGTAPDARIVAAHAVGLGPELEIVLASAAVERAAGLPDDVLLFVNLSPVTLLDESSRDAIRDAARPLVVEITEGAPIGSYADIRRAMLDLPGFRLAVDDAGVGYTSLTNITQLHPDYVKLDISLVHGVDNDARLQAMVAAMCRFAQQTGTILVAEGVETEGEADTIRELGAELAPGHLLGQGYFFGRPAPLP